MIKCCNFSLLPLSLVLPHLLRLELVILYICQTFDKPCELVAFSCGLYVQAGSDSVSDSDSNKSKRSNLPVEEK